MRPPKIQIEKLYTFDAPPDAPQAYLFARRIDDWGWLYAIDTRRTAVIRARVYFNSNDVGGLVEPDMIAIARERDVSLLLWETEYCAGQTYPRLDRPDVESEWLRIANRADALLDTDAPSSFMALHPERTQRFISAMIEEGPDGEQVIPIWFDMSDTPILHASRPEHDVRAAMRPVTVEGADSSKLFARIKKYVWDSAPADVLEAWQELFGGAA